MVIVYIIVKSHTGPNNDGPWSQMYQWKVRFHRNIYMTDTNDIN